MVKPDMAVVGTEPAQSCATLVHPDFTHLHTLRLDQLFGSGTLREPFRVQALVGEGNETFSADGCAGSRHVPLALAHLDQKAICALVSGARTCFTERGCCWGIACGEDLAATPAGGD